MEPKLIIQMIILATALVGNAERPRGYVKTGKYSPQLFGESGKYMPDNRGKYRHIPYPYDGGYGDRGEKYIHDGRSRYWHQNGPSGTWEEPDGYANVAPYAEESYQPDPSVPSYLPPDWGPNPAQTYAVGYKYDANGWRIIQFQWSKDGRTRYSYLYETENKILAEEIGKLAKLDDSTSAIRVDGFYKYEGDDGTEYTVDYVANEHGFFPKGKHIHKSIQNVLNFLMQNATKIPISGS